MTGRSLEIALAAFKRFPLTSGMLHDLVFCVDSSKGYYCDHVLDNCMVEGLKRAELVELIRSTSLLTGQFKLRSGLISSIYLDKYRFEGDPILLSALVDELEKLLPESFDKLAGLELGGIPLATGLSLKTGKKCLFVRKAPKTYGTCNLVEGGYSLGEEAVVVEDVITTAGQVCKSIKQMRERGLVVQNAVCVVDRQQGGKKSLQDIGCSLASVFGMDELC